MGLGCGAMKRVYEELIHRDLEENRQMIFMAGPRQVGKTTCSLSAERYSSDFHYLNWDVPSHRQLIIAGPDAVAEKLGLLQAKSNLPIVVFDEIHKYGKWKQFLKGFFDIYGSKVRIIVTGSAKLNIYKAGSDSLMGRYFLYRIHPFSVAEVISPKVIDKEIKAPHEIDSKQFNQLFEFGGFPEPFIKHSKSFATRWQRLKQQQLFKEDIRELSQIQELASLEMLAEILKSQAGQLVSYSNIANAVNVSIPTIQKWIKSLEAFYYCFTIKPWSKNVKRALRKEPKIYLWDWSVITDRGAKCENFVAAHLLKAVHYWTDRGFGDYELYFIRDKEKREVDFLVTKDKKPWFLVEVKQSKNHSISKALYQFQKITGAAHAFQVVFDMDYVSKDCFDYTEPVIVPIQTLLSQLV